MAGNQLIDWRGPSGNLASNFAGYLNSQTLGGAPYWKQLAAFAPPPQCLAPPPPPPPPAGTPTALPTPTPAPTILPGAHPLPHLACCAPSCWAAQAECCVAQCPD